MIPNYDIWGYEDPTIFFSVERANDALRFIRENCTHVEGILRGKSFIPQPWQEAIIGAIFGFFRIRSDDGKLVRRFKEVFVYVPRKNGKTPLIAAITCYEFFCGPEQGQQCYVCAGNKEQANIFSRTLIGMIKNNLAFDSQVTIRGASEKSPLSALSVSVVRHDDQSFIKTVSSVAETKHGFNINLAVIEEVHAHKFRDLYDTMKTAMVSANRISPLLIGISTADKERPSICNELLDYSHKVCANPASNPRFLPVVYEPLKGDDWKDEQVWKRVNPNLGISVSLDDLRSECEIAKVNPGYASVFKRLHVNLKTLDIEKAFEGLALKTDLKGLSPLQWRRWIFEELKGESCIAGLDLAATNDIVALVLLFKGLEGFSKYLALPFFWISESALSEKSIHQKKRNYAQFKSWIDQGFLKLINHPTIKVGEVINDIKEIGSTFPISYLIADILFQGLQAAQDLQDAGFNVEAFSNNFSTHTTPTKELFQILSDGELDHGNNPILLWMMENAVTESNHAGYIRFTKQKSKDKIDGVIGLVMALNKYLFLDASQKKKKSIYETRGIKAI